MTFDLSSLGWDDGFASAYARYDRPDHQPVRVTRVDRGICTVLGASGSLRGTLSGALLHAAAGDPAEQPCAGDWVVLRTWADDRTTIEARLPRRTAIIRRTSDKASIGQVLAANLDTAAVVEPMHPSPDLGRIERLLTLAWESGGTPLVVLTKADLAADPVDVAEQVSESAPGAEVIAVSAERGDGLDRLAPLVAHGCTLALLGPSGAGKSTLVNALAGTSVMITQGIRRADGKGRHTTTYRALVPIPGGGAVLDTPGIRGVGLLDAETGLDQAFADVVALAAVCRFNDCQHNGEPGCAVRAALESGDLAPRRFESWCRLQREIAFEMRRRDARLAAEERNRWKRIHKSMRSRPARP